ncbi:MAG: insulinase family protein [Flavobacteriales bacterium]|nr:insulinase family protein [Flavobacteriales bacterium]
MRHLLLLLSFMLTFTTHAQKSPAYQSFPDDPLGLRIYTLENGLQVWLSRNTDAPRVQTMIAVRTGSKQDPDDATGLAHYLEHMLFKGTSRMGTTNWAEESKLLQQISDTYEQRRRTTVETERAALYRRIDSLSTLAARLAVPNEYDKMISSLGAKGTNAYTSTERTVYVNDIPSPELERWMRVEGERFRECVLRLFHTELETVYEEFNRAQDNDGRTASKKLNEMLYPQHPYGTHTTIGTGEHLKDPSMVKIMEYFRTHYVPNNMAVILSGDIDYDKTVAMVKKYFGDMPRREVPPFTFPDDGGLSGPQEAEVFGPQAAWVDIAWRLPAYDPAQVDMLELIDGLLNNGTAGLMDLDLVQAQRVLRASTYAYQQQDYGTFGMRGEPRQGQSLEEVRDLLLKQMERVREGQFEPWLIEAVVTDLRKRRTRSWTESNSARGSAMVDAFILGKQWSDVVGQPDRMARITREQVMDFAKTNLDANYMLVYKRTGPNPDVHKVAKPPITPLDLNRADMSAWRKEWDKMKPADLKPVFVDYSTALQRGRLGNGARLVTVPNTLNDLFSLNYIVDVGTDHDRELAVALRYLNYMGTRELSPAAFKERLFRLGLDMDTRVSTDRTVVTLSGLQKSFAEGLALLEEVMRDGVAPDNALPDLVTDILKQRQDNMRNKAVVLNQALWSHARYGEVNPFNDVLSEETLRQLQPTDLRDRLRKVCQYPHMVFFYGSLPATELQGVLNKYHDMPMTLALPAARPYTEQDTRRSAVRWVDHDMVQAEMLLVHKGEPFNVEKLPYAALFNEYFGSGLSSIVFQEIREAKALAYGASVSYTSPAKKDEAHYVRGFIGTQADKLPDAVAALQQLMNNMPMDETQFAGAKESALRAIASERIVREQLFWSWDAAVRRGLDRDVRKDLYERIPAITLKDMKAFFDREVKDKPYTYCVIGRRDKLDMEALGRLGTVTELSKSVVFGYEEVKQDARPK